MTTYQNVVTGPSATLDFRFAGGGGIRRIGIAEEQSCTALQEYDGKSPAKIPVGKALFIIQGWEGVYGGGCKIAYSFTPQDGYDYVSEFSSERNQCLLRVARVLPNGQKVSDPTVVQKPKPFCLNF